jgi:uncharacterized membrane protein YbhN (UPF0104 family)
MLRAALPQERVRASPVVRATMIGVLGSALVPGRVGEPARAWLVTRRHGSPGTVVGTMVSQTLLNLVALALLAAAALRGLRALHPGPGALLGALAVPLVVVALLLVGRPLARAAPRSDRLRRLGGWVVRQLDAVRRGITVFRSGREGTLIAAVQLAAWALQLLAAYALILALRLPVGLDVAAAVLVAVNVTAIVPVTPSNVGIFQAACVAVLSAYGVPAAQGLAYGLILQAAEVATAIALGLPAVLAEGVSVRALLARGRVASDAG